ncbi:hypothetical protein STEG23_004725, partial [Scotinomys teguina]
LMPYSAIIKEASCCTMWEQIQRYTARYYGEREREREREISTQICPKEYILIRVFFHHLKQRMLERNFIAGSVIKYPDKCTHKGESVYYYDFSYSPFHWYEYNGKM